MPPILRKKTAEHQAQVAELPCVDWVCQVIIQNRFLLSRAEEGDESTLESPVPKGVKLSSTSEVMEQVEANLGVVITSLRFDTIRRIMLLGVDPDSLMSQQVNERHWHPHETADMAGAFRIFTMLHSQIK